MEKLHEDPSWGILEPILNYYLHKLVQIVATACDEIELVLKEKDKQILESDP